MSADTFQQLENQNESDFVDITPTVNANAEFFEIAHDFGDALELVREAISNSLDADASTIDISFDVQQIDGDGVLVITITDDGNGMSRETLERDFWGLGYSTSRGDDAKIGEKGHGTKIYLRSERIIVRTQTTNTAFESVCDNPIRSLYRHEVHKPRIRPISNFRETSGTEIKIYGYNKSARSGTKYFQQNVVDFIKWFTKFGSVEQEFARTQLSGKILRVKGLDADKAEEITFGHIFPPESPSVTKLFEKYSTDAAEMFVKRYRKSGRLEAKPEVEFDAVIYVEGDAAKRDYNPMIRGRTRVDTGRYKVADRYGIYLCKDFVPIERKNDWITGFGWGSNSFVLLHGFVNCQALRLTANRDSIANTDPILLDELRKVVKTLTDEIDTDLRKGDFYTLLQWQFETKTKEQEKTEYDRRVRAITHRKTARLDGHVLVEPQNESELFGLFISLAVLKPELFAFEPLDYVTSRGVDILARTRNDRPVSESEFAYVELKHKLKTEGFNHSFMNLKWIVCWDFDSTVRAGAEFKSAVEETDIRILEVDLDPALGTAYFLSPRRGTQKIQVVNLRQLLREKLALEFK